MRIKKTSQTTPVQAEVVNIYSDSENNAYSANYLNNNQANAKILWTNPNPGSVISSDTAITLSSDDYDYILWVIRVSTTNNLSCSNTSFKGYGLRTYIGGNYRNITRNNDTSYTINPANSTDFNNALIPIYAIGYKTGLFS